MVQKKNLLERFKAKYGDSDEYLIEKLALAFHAEIGKAMKRTGMTQSELAERLGVKQPYVSKLVNCSPNLTLRSLAVIAKALDSDWEHPRLVGKHREADAITDSGVMIPADWQVVQGDPHRSWVNFGGEKKAFTAMALNTQTDKEVSDDSSVAYAA